ncbi:enoyl-CoA hydratase-related protein [Alphaproteobacteria bacterium LSUCC0684]
MKTLITKSHGSWIEIRLNRPERLNAFTKPMMAELHAALVAAGDDTSCRAVMITGEGRAFSAGQDLNEVDDIRELDLKATLENHFNPLVELIRALQKPVVAAVNGVAAGAGANIALSCDIVLASEDAQFMEVFSRIGLIPDAGGTWLLRERLGEMRAKALAFTAAPISARQALDWGLAWEIYESEGFADAARDFTGRLASGPTHAYALAKTAIQEAATNTMEDQLKREAELQHQAGQSPDHLEGVAAFREKRPASFTGAPSSGKE